MKDTPVMINEEQVTIVKAMALTTVSAFTGLYGVLKAAVGGVDTNTVAIGSTLAVSVTFATFILRMVIKNQAAIWDIVKAKDVEIRQLRYDKEYAEWDREQTRYRTGERQSDPGPFLPSQPRTLPETTTA